MNYIGVLSLLFPFSDLGQLYVAHSPGVSEGANEGAHSLVSNLVGAMEGGVSDITFKASDVSLLVAILVLLLITLNCLVFHGIHRMGFLQRRLEFIIFLFKLRDPDFKKVDRICKRVSPIGIGGDDYRPKDVEREAYG